MRKTPEDYEGEDLDLIYIAKKLSEALRLESLFTERGIDYLVEADEYVGGILFRTQRVGAFFYVTPRNREAARAMMSEIGLKPHQA